VYTSSNLSRLRDLRGAPWFVDFKVLGRDSDKRERVSWIYERRTTRTSGIQGEAEAKREAVAQAQSLGTGKLGIHAVSFKKNASQRLDTYK
jgi:hypothetical protein